MGSKNMQSRVSLESFRGGMRFSRLGFKGPWAGGIRRGKIRMYETQKDLMCLRGLGRKDLGREGKDLPLCVTKMTDSSLEDQIRDSKITILGATAIRRKR